MKRLTSSIFQLIYSITQFRMLSYVLAIAYMTVLNSIMLDGLSILLADLVPVIGMLHRLLVMPFVLITIIPIAAITALLSPRPRYIIRDAKMARSYPVLVLYTALVVLLFAYSQFPG